jgi:hypothetical protein
MELREALCCFVLCSLNTTLVLTKRTATLIRVGGDNLPVHLLWKGRSAGRPGDAPGRHLHQKPALPMVL